MSERGLSAEQALLGSMLQDERILPDVIHTVREEDFALDVDRLIFAAMRDMYIHGKPIDGVTVRARIGQDYLYYGEWLDMRSIGALLGVDHSTVCRTIHRAAGRIRALCTDSSGVELLGVDALEPALYALYRQHAADDLIPERARAAARRATASGAQKRQERTPDRTLITAPIWGQRRHRAAAQSRLLRALEDAAAQRTGSLLARLRALLRAFRVKITRAA